MRFSIIITTYNRCTLLQRAIQSCLQQTGSVEIAEIIVVDDASSDGTERLMLAWQAALVEQGDRRLIYHRNLENQGHSRSVNQGVALASGDWIKFLDDDDYLAANCLAVLKDMLSLHPQAAICSCQAIQVDEWEQELERTPSAGPGRAFFIPQEDIHYGMLLEIVPFGTPAQVAVKRQVFLDSGGWNPDFDGNCDDIDAWIRMARFGDAVFINQCLAYRTVWTGSLNQTFSLRKRFETNLVMKQKIHRLVHPKYGARLPPIQTIERYLRLHWGLITLRSGYWRQGLQTLLPACCFFKPWVLLLRALMFRQCPWLIRHPSETMAVTTASIGVTTTTTAGTAISNTSEIPSNYFADFRANLFANPSAQSAHSFANPSANLPASLPANLPKNPAANLLGLKGSKSRSVHPLLEHTHPHAGKYALSKTEVDTLKYLRYRLQVRRFWLALKQRKFTIALAILRQLSLIHGLHWLTPWAATMDVSKIPLKPLHWQTSRLAETIEHLLARSSQRYQTNLRHVRHYLRLRWAWAAFKQGYLLTALWIGIPASRSFAAWGLWISLMRIQHYQLRKDAIRKMVLFREV